MDKFVALVPMKAHSERVKNKNILEIGGKPLFYYILETLEDCEYISEICVDTDSPVIKDKIKHDFRNVKIIDRPANLVSNSVSMNQIIAHDLTQVKGEHFLQTHATNPLLKPETIARAIEFFLSHKEYDSLFSVTRLQKRLYNSKGKPLNHEIGKMLNTQDLEPIYEENSCVFLFSRSSFNSNGRNRIGKKPGMFEISKEESIDIDDEFDFKLSKMLIESRF